MQIEAACDVKNPLTGENGASYVFGWQKGGDEKSIQLLDKNLTNGQSNMEKAVKNIVRLLK